MSNVTVVLAGFALGLTVASFVFPGPLVAIAVILLAIAVLIRG